MIPAPIQKRLDMIGLKIVRGKEAIDRKDGATAKSALEDAFRRLLEISEDGRAGIFRHLSEDASIDISKTLDAMISDLEALLPKLLELARTEGEQSDYGIVDAEERSRQNITFPIPPERARRNLQPGDLAKLIFQSSAGGERMWIRVTDVLGRGQYEGTLDSAPVTIPSLKHGSRIKFEAKNVISIEKQAPLN